MPYYTHVLHVSLFVIGQPGKRHSMHISWHWWIPIYIICTSQTTTFSFNLIPFSMSPKHNFVGRCYKLLLFIYLLYIIIFNWGHGCRRTTSMRWLSLHEGRLLRLASTPAKYKYLLMSVAICLASFSSFNPPSMLCCSLLSLFNALPTK